MKRNMQNHTPTSELPRPSGAFPSADYQKLYYRCCSYYPRDRPTFREIIDGKEPSEDGSDAGFKGLLHILDELSRDM